LEERWRKRDDRHHTQAPNTTPDTRSKDQFPDHPSGAWQK
jgi:hypothetical protein